MKQVAAVLPPLRACIRTGSAHPTAAGGRRQGAVLGHSPRRSWKSRRVDETTPPCICVLRPGSWPRSHFLARRQPGRQRAMGRKPHTGRWTPKNQLGHAQTAWLCVPDQVVDGRVVGVVEDQHHGEHHHGGGDGTGGEEDEQQQPRSMQTPDPQNLTPKRQKWS